MRRKSTSLGQIIGIRWPILFILIFIFLCQCLAEGTHKFISGDGQNEIAQMKTFGGGQAKSNNRVASSVPSNWEGSGAIPDDEDGDVNEEGSGDGPSEEGSGIPPAAEEFNHRKPNGSVVAITDTRSENDREKQKHYANASTTIIDLNIFSAPSPTRAVPTVTTTATVVLATTLRPPLMKPTTTAFSSQDSKSSSSKISTTTLPKVFKPKTEEKWPQPPTKSTSPPFTPTRTTKRPFFISDPSGTLEQLRPGIFAFMVGGVVVGLLLLILIISYLVYRLKKRDEGTYICEEPHQQTHYPYAYQKASIREFYA